MCFSFTPFFQARTHWFKVLLQTFEDNVPKGFKRIPGRNIKGNSFGPSMHRRQAAVNSHTHSSQTSLWISPQDHAEPRMADRIKKIKPVEGIQKTLLRDCFEPSRIAPMFWILEATPGLNRWALLVHLARLTRL